MEYNWKSGRVMTVQQYAVSVMKQYVWAAGAGVVFYTINILQAVKHGGVNTAGYIKYIADKAMDDSFGANNWHKCGVG
jgi:hypothetical protein